jgi:hypothetical protein
MAAARSRQKEAKKRKEKREAKRTAVDRETVKQLMAESTDGRNNPTGHSTGPATTRPMPGSGWGLVSCVSPVACADWDELAKEARLAKKLKRGKISKEEYNRLMAEEEDAEEPLPL